MNNDNEPWKQLCSIMGPVLDEDDDDDIGRPLISQTAELKSRSWKEFGS